MKKRNESGGKHIANPASKKLKEKKPEQIRPIRQFPEKNELELELERILEEPAFTEETAPLMGNELIPDAPKPELTAAETVPSEPLPKSEPEEVPAVPESDLAPEERVVEGGIGSI